MAWKKKKRLNIKKTDYLKREILLLSDEFFSGKISNELTKNRLASGEFQSASIKSKRKIVSGGKGKKRGAFTNLTYYGGAEQNRGKTLFFFFSEIMLGQFKNF